MICTGSMFSYRQGIVADLTHTITAKEALTGCDAIGQIGIITKTKARDHT